MNFNLELCEKLKNGEINCYFLSDDEIPLIKQLLSYVFPDDESTENYDYSHSYQIFYADYHYNDKNDEWAVYSLFSKIDFMLECLEPDVFNVKQFYNLC